MSGPLSPGVTSPVRVSARHHHHHLPHSSHHHPSLTAQVSNTLHRRARSRDERVSNTMAAQQQMAPRASLEVPRSEGVTPGNLTPNQSRRGSVSLTTPGVVASSALPMTTTTTGFASGTNKEEVLHRERETAEARTRGLKRSFVDLTTSTTKTSRRLDDAYRVIYETLPYLQQTILNLKELAVASTTMNEGFIEESRAVVSEAQAQLEAFGSFDEQQARVQALQDRVHSGQEKIASLSARVDVVRQRVEQWERADREWQERTRRRLKIVWGFVLAALFILTLLYIGARTYAPEIEGVTRELQEEAMLVKMRLDGGLKGSEITKSSSQAEEGNGVGDYAVPALNFSRGGRDEARDEAFRALDEL